MILYKLTNEKHQTRNETQWGEGVEHTASGVGEMGAPGWIHAYRHPVLAALMNPVHDDFEPPVLWECDGDEPGIDDGMKCGTRRLRTLRIIPLPAIATEQRVRFAILCALRVYSEPSFVAWARRWLGGDDMSLEAAESAAESAEAAMAARAAAAAAMAAWAAAAAMAAWAAAWAAARAAAAAMTARAAARAEEAAEIDLLAIAAEAGIQ